MGTARELGRIGPLVLELLQPPERTPAGREALHEVQAAGGVLSALVIPLLGDYSGRPSYEVRAELAALAEFSPRRDMSVVGEVTGGALTGYLGAARAQYPAVRGGGLFADLGFLQGQDALLSIEVSHCSGIRGLEGLMGLPVRSAVLDLRGASLPFGPVFATRSRPTPSDPSVCPATAGSGPSPSGVLGPAGGGRGAGARPAPARPGDPFVGVPAPWYFAALTRP
ncbi:hypothetical protein [Streptomyces sp. NPDC059742]|uniref:hypothetical protein n=1 Tax=Streptomyces sp. NPDC059742 TaxID=3346927 RepID=UPI00364B28B4